MEEIVQLISTLGFPIAISVYLLYVSEKTRHESREDQQKWCDAINRNTAVIEALRDKISN